MCNRLLNGLPNKASSIIVLFIVLLFFASCERKDGDKQENQIYAAEVKRLNEKANLYIETNPKLALIIIDSSVLLNKDHYDEESEIQSLYLKGKCNRILENKKEAYSAIYASLKMSIESNNNKYRVFNLTELSEIQFSENLYEKADSVLTEAEKLAQENHFYYSLPAIYNSKAVIAENSGQKAKAAGLYLKTLAFYKFEKNEKAEAVIYNNLGLLYRSMNNYKEALKFLKLSVEINQKNNFLAGLAESYNNLGVAYYDSDSAKMGLDAYKKSLRLYKQLGRSADLAKIYLNVANLLTERDELVIANNYYDSSMVICQQYNIGLGIILNKINRGGLYAKMGNHQQAIIYYKSGLEQVKKLNLLDLEQQTEFLLISSYKSLGNFQLAVQHMEHYDRLKDSVSGTDVKNQIAELQVKYNKAEQETEISRLNENILLEKSKSRLMIIISLAFGVFLLIVGFLFILQRRKTLYKNKLEKSELEQTRLNLELKNKELITNAIHLASFTGFSENLAEQIKKIIDENAPSAKDALSGILNQIDNAVPKNAWKDFETRFEQVHEVFYEKLFTDYPDLSPAEIKICSFLRLNLTTKDIALLTHRSQRTIENQRISIRKKMNLTSDSSLEIHLLKL